VAFFGVLATSVGLGAMASGLAASWLMRAVGRSAPLRIGLGAACAGLLVQSTGLLACAVVGELLVGAGMVLVSTWYLTLYQMSTPTELVGRTDGALNAVVSVSQTMCTAVGAALNGIVDYRIMLLATVSLLLAGLLGAPSGMPTQDIRQC
jgi:hypothetical protein